MRERHAHRVREEFGRAAAGFAARTEGRFDDLGVVEFARVRRGDTVVEVGAGTGNFLSLFRGHAARLIGIDLTPAMLAEAARRHDGLFLAGGDGTSLPLKDAAVDVACSAQTLHHIHRPVPVLAEMGRVVSDDGRILVVDQVAPEHYEEALVMTQLEILRDPSHAMSRPPSAFHIMAAKAGLEIVDERIAERRSRLSKWMWRGEFPQERIDAVREFIRRLGALTGMGFEPDGDDYTFTRRRIMLLARRSG